MSSCTNRTLISMGLFGAKRCGRTRKGYRRFVLPNVQRDRQHLPSWRSHAAMHSNDERAAVRRYPHAHSWPRYIVCAIMFALWTRVYTFVDLLCMSWQFQTLNGHGLEYAGGS